MKHKIIKILVIIISTAAGVLLLIAALLPQYKSVISEDDIAQPYMHLSLLNKPGEFDYTINEETSLGQVRFDPMSLVDATFDIYVPTEPVGVTVAPKESYIYKNLRPGEAIMYRQDITNGYHKVQDVDGKIFYIGDDDLKNKMVLIETRDGAVTELMDVPKDKPKYVVKYDGDRVLRFTKSLILDDNVAGIIKKGTIAYKVRDYEQIFFVVLEDGRCGYMNSQCLEIVEPEESVYDIVTAYDSSYDYNEMLEDIVLLTERYPDDLKVVDVGYSTLGHSIPVLLIGNENAQYKILIQASIHAREYASTPTLMKQMEVMLYHLDNENSSGRTYRHILDKVAYYIIPMANPDGVMLSEIGIISIEDQQIRQQVLAIRNDNESPSNAQDYKYYFEQWKGNINGVDLNRNFDANWDKVHDEVGKPAGDGYKGPSVESEVETQFLKKYVDMDDVKVTISYHTAGNMLFWWYYQESDFYSTCYDLARVIKKANYYEVMSKAQSRYSHGGMKDYATMMGKPSVTYEIGTYSSPIPPISVKHAASKTRVLPIIGEWLIDEINKNEMWLTVNMFENVLDD